MAISSVKFDIQTNGNSSATYSPGRNPNIASEQPLEYDGISAKRSLSGKTFTVANHDSSRLSRKLAYSNLSETDKNKLVALFNYAKGQLNFFYYTENGSFGNSDRVTVRFINNKLNVTEVAYNVYNVDIEIEEQL